MTSFDSFVPPHIRQLRPYQPGRPIDEIERELGITGAIKLASNENPLGACAGAIEAARAALESVHYYPDGGAYHLRHRLANELDVAPERLVFGAGSNDLIGLIMSAFCRSGVDTVIAQKHAFISYRISAVSRGLEFIETAVNEELGCDVDAMIEAIDERTKVVLLANPNNPTGSYVGTKDFERLLEAIPPNVVFVVDEAYREYARRAAADYPIGQDYLGPDRPLMVNLRTFSKIHGLAGLRVGFGVCDPRFANVVDRVRRPFNVTSVGQAAATAALDDPGHVERSSEIAQASIARWRQEASDLGVRVYPSVANFVLVDVGRESAPVNETMMRAGVIVRPMAAWGLPSCLRISIGSDADTARAIRALADAL